MKIYTRFLFAAGTFLVIGTISSQPAVAEECKPLTLLTTLDMVPVKDDAAVIVKTKIDGSDELMLLDTGGIFSNISYKTAKALGLEMRRTRLAMVDISGRAINVVARAHSFALGRLHASNMDFMIGNELLTDIGGIIAPNILAHYDVELDFTTHKVNLLSQDHCEGKVVYWPAETIAVVPIRVAKSGHVLIPVDLDGIKMEAIVDTGATHTALSQPVAESDFDLKVGTSDTPNVGHLAGSPNSQIYSHRFKQLTMGGIGVPNPEALIIPDLMKHMVNHPLPIGARIGSADEPRGLPDITVGMDILHHLHLYIAYGEEKLYVTPTTSAPAPASTGAALQSSSNR